MLCVNVLAQDKADPPKPASHTVRKIEGWTVRVDDRLLQPPHEAMGVRVLKALERKLADINAVVRPDRLEKLHAVTIVLDMSHGKLRADAVSSRGPVAGGKRLRSRDLVHCVHIPVAAELLEPRQINVQPWCVLHELAHAYHDQVLGFDEARIRDAYAAYKKSGHGDAALLITGERVRHYGLTDHKEFFAEMTESYFGTNDFFPFNRAELKEAEPEIYKLLADYLGAGGDRADQGASASRRSHERHGVALSGSVPGVGGDNPVVRPAGARNGTRPCRSATAGWGPWSSAGRPASGYNSTSRRSGRAAPTIPRRPGGPEALPEIRRLVFAGKYVEAEELFGKTHAGQAGRADEISAAGKPARSSFPATPRRPITAGELDLDTAIADVSYRVGDVHFRREVFVQPGGPGDRRPSHGRQAGLDFADGEA